jgi:hypothetical protein
MLNRDSAVTRYLMPDEEERLLPVLTGRYQHLLNITLLSAVKEGWGTWTFAQPCAMFMRLTRVSVVQLKRQRVVR